MSARRSSGASKRKGSARGASSRSARTAEPNAVDPATDGGLGHRRSRARLESSEEYLRRRSELLAAAAAVFHQKGLSETTLGDVAEAAGTDRATVYYYVKNKHELFAEVIRDSMLAVEAGAEEIDSQDLAPREKLRRLIVDQMTKYATHYPYLYIYAVEDLARLEVDQPWQQELAGHGQRVFDIYRGVVAAGMNDGTFGSELSAGVLAQTVLGTVAWSHRWYRPESGMDPVATGEALAALILTGLMAERAST
jgi:TetR/AcrR family transcriptional regulator, cholesterol catabolism regulator